MGLPNVKINIGNGQLGRSATTDDGVAGLVIPATAKPNLPLYTPKQIFSLKEAETLGLTIANDVAEQIDAWQQIKEFFDEAGSNAELNIMTYPMERTLTQMCDPTNTGTNSVRTLLDFAEGRITLLAIGRYINPTLVYNQVNQGGIDADVHTAMLKLNVMALEYRDAFSPFSAFMDCRGWNGVVADLTDLRTYSYEKVTGVLCSSQSGKKSAAMGLVLGRYAKIPVQRSCGRVKDGGVNVAVPAFTDGLILKKFSRAKLDTIHDKGYLFFTNFTGRSGAYFNDDPTCTPQNNDYLTVANNRVIDKALRLMYVTYVGELNDEVSVSADGKIAPTQITYLQQIMANALQTMVDAGNISDYEVFIDPTQNVIATDKLIVSVKVLPVGHTKFIEGNLSFKNPAS